WLFQHPFAALEKQVAVEQRVADVEVRERVKFDGVELLGERHFVQDHAHAKALLSQPRRNRSCDGSRSQMRRMCSIASARRATTTAPGSASRSAANVRLPITPSTAMTGPPTTAHMAV